MISPFQIALTFFSPIVTVSVTVVYLVFIINPESPIRLSIKAMRASLSIRSLRVIMLSNSTDDISKDDRDALLNLIAGSLICILVYCFGIIISTALSFHFSTELPAIASIGTSLIVDAAMLGAFRATLALMVTQLSKEWEGFIQTLNDISTLKQDRHLNDHEKQNLKLLLALVIIVLVVFIIVELFQRLVASTMPESIVLKSIAATVFIFGLFIYSFWQKWRRRKEYATTIKTINTDDLIAQSSDRLQAADLAAKIAEICQQQKVLDVVFIVHNNRYSDCYCEMKTWSTPSVHISESLLEYPNGSIDKIVFLLSHEISHIKHKDATRTAMRRGIAGLLCAAAYLAGIITSLSLCLVGGSVGSLLTIVFLAFFMIALHKIASITCDERYWRGIAELRADREALEFSSCPIELTRSIFESNVFLESERENQAAFNQRNPIFRWYKRKYSNFVHPPISCRVAFLEKEWGIHSYFDYYITIRSWHKDKKGWLGY